MAPLLRPRASLQKDKFAAYFAPLKSQFYSDPASSGRGSSSSVIRSIAWNPLGNLVATGSSDKTLRVCKCSPAFPCSDGGLTNAGNPEKPTVRFSTELKGHAASIQKVAFNPVKDAELASVSDDGVVKFWDVRTKNCINEVKGLGDAFTLVWAPDGESLIVGNKVSVARLLYYCRCKD
jgi:THO complex subunit 3